MYDRNGENHYDMIKRDDAKNLENYNFIKKIIKLYNYENNFNDRFLEISLI